GEERGVEGVFGCFRCLFGADVAFGELEGDGGEPFVVEFFQMGDLFADDGGDFAHAVEAEAVGFVHRVEAGGERGGCGGDLRFDEFTQCGEFAAQLGGGE